MLIQKKRVRNIDNYITPFDGRSVFIAHPLPSQQKSEVIGLKWFTEFGHLNRGDMLTSEQHRCHNEKKKFQRRV